MFESLNSNTQVEIYKTTHYSKNSIEIKLQCTICLSTSRRQKRFYKSTAKLNHHLSQHHTDPIEANEVNLIKKALEGISIGLEIGVLGTNNRFSTKKVIKNC